MDFEWDRGKELANRRKHGINFKTAAKVFLDPHLIEFDDRDATGELRFNAIGVVDGRMLFVTYTMRSDVVRIISARGAEPRAGCADHPQRGQGQQRWQLVRDGTPQPAALAFFKGSIMSTITQTRTDYSALSVRYEFHANRENFGGSRINSPATARKFHEAIAADFPDADIDVTYVDSYSSMKPRGR